MGRGRSTLVLFLVLVALGAYIFFVERKREPATDGDAEVKKKVFSVEAGKIEELQVRGGGGDQTTLKKEGARWKLVSPVAADADEGEVSGITSNLASLEQQRVIDEKPADLKPYGLDTPKIAVGFRAAGDKATKRLLLGSKTPTGGDMYAKLEDAAPVFLVSGYLDGAFDRSTFDLRDKSVLKIERDKVDGIDLRTSSGTLRFAKTQDAWSLAEPVQARADFGAVEGLLGRIATARMKAIVEADAADLEKYGLGTPAYTLGLSAGSARSTFLVGSQTTDGQFYARDASRPLVFTVDAVLVDDLKKPPADYRMKDLFEFRTFTGSRLEFTRDGASVVFEKQKGKDKDAPEKWAQVQPKKDVEQDKILDFLSRLTNLRADTFVDALPAGAVPAASAKATSAEGKKEDAVTFFKAGDDVFATRPGEPGAAKMSATEFNEAIKLLDALK